MCVCAYLPCSRWPWFISETIWCEVGRRRELERDEEMKRCTGGIQREARGRRDWMGIEGNKRCDTAKVWMGHSAVVLTVIVHSSLKCLMEAKAREWLMRRVVVVSSQTFVVLTLLPVLQLHPVRSGRTLHSSPSIQGCIWHHHFWATMEAGGREQSTYTVLKDSFRLYTVPRWCISERLTSNRNNFYMNNTTSVLVSPQWGATKPLMI